MAALEDADSAIRAAREIGQAATLMIALAIRSSRIPRRHRNRAVQADRQNNYTHFKLGPSIRRLCSIAKHWS